MAEKIFFKAWLNDRQEWLSVMSLWLNEDGTIDFISGYTSTGQFITVFSDFDIVHSLESPEGIKQ